MRLDEHCGHRERRVRHRIEQNQLGTATVREYQRSRELDIHQCIPSAKASQLNAIAHLVLISENSARFSRRNERVKYDRPR